MHNRFAQKKNLKETKPLADFLLQEVNQVASSFIVMGYTGGSHDKYFLACHKNEKEGEALSELSGLVSAWYNLSKQDTDEDEKDITSTSKYKFDR